MTLFVRFTSGEWYAYLGVPQAVAEDLEKAESHGRAFQARIRDRYPYRRLDLNRP